MERRGPCGSISYQPLSRPPITPPLPLRTRPPSSKQGERQKARPLRQLLMQKRMPSLDRHRGGIADSGERGHVNRPRCHSPQGAYQSRIHAPLPHRRVWPWPGARTHPRGTQSFVDPWAARRGRLAVDRRWGESERLGSCPRNEEFPFRFPIPSLCGSVAAEDKRAGGATERRLCLALLGSIGSTARRFTASHNGRLRLQRCILSKSHEHRTDRVLMHIPRVHKERTDLTPSRADHQPGRNGLCSPPRRGLRKPPV